jgi:hypothetical protein
MIGDGHVSVKNQEKQVNFSAGTPVCSGLNLCYKMP